MLSMLNTGYTLSGHSYRPKFSAEVEVEVGEEGGFTLQSAAPATLVQDGRPGEVIDGGRQAKGLPTAPFTDPGGGFIPEDFWFAHC